MLGIEARHGHRRLEVKAQPFLNTYATQLRGAFRQIEEEYEIQHNRRCENRITAEEIHLDLHGIAEPSKDVDIVPALFVVTARRVIVNANLVRELAIELRVKVWLQNVLQH